MKTITKILFYTFIMCFIAGQMPALAQVPQPTDCGNYPFATASGIHYKVNGTNYPANGSKSDSEYMKFNQGRVLPGSKVEMYFNTKNAPGRYTLVTYRVMPDESMEVFDYESVVFPIGNSNILTAKVPNCKYRVYFIKGCLEDPITTAKAANIANPFSGSQTVYDYAVDQRVNASICEPICEYTTGTLPNQVQFRLIELNDNGNGTSNIIFSVINKTTDFLIGDLILESPNAMPIKNNIPYQFRYDYQIDNTPQTNTMTIRFDQRNNHNNHIYDNLQSELIIYPIRNTDLPATIEICAELDGKHPEPGQTPGDTVCATFRSDCGEDINEPCRKQENGILVELLDFTSIAGNQTPIPFRITNSNGADVASVEIAFSNTPLTPATDNLILSGSYDKFTFSQAISHQGAASPAGNEVMTYTYTAGADLYDNGEDVTFTTTVGTNELLANFAQAIVTVNLVGGTSVTLDTFNTAECGNIVPLPVTLVSFKGTVMSDKSMKLLWKTASEENNDRFEVERSENGKDFIAIGMVKGNGTTNEVNDYTFSDITPMKGMNYYRLRQVDTDGKFEFSKVIALNSNAESGTMNINMIPNPCLDGNCIVQLNNLNQNERTVIEIHDMTGRLIYTEQVQNNHENYTLATDKLHLDKGIYILSAQSGKVRSIDKIVIK